MELDKCKTDLLEEAKSLIMQKDHREIHDYLTGKSFLLSPGGKIIIINRGCFCLQVWKKFW